MKDFLKKVKEDIYQYLVNNQELFSKDRVISACHGGKLLNELVEFSGRGKMVRGGLVSYCYKLFTGQDRHPHSIALGALLELLQSALLIHDDIMDQDELRRGKETLYFQYQKEGLGQGIEQARHRGVSLAICGGDVSLFWAMDLLGQMDLNQEMSQQLLERISREMVYVGLAQMEDVRNGHRKDSVSLEAILNLYRFKTGRYTFSLPLMLGAILAGKSRHIQDTLAHWGELLGILFQIKDDYLGLAGDKDKLGKPLGSDIREGKQTIYFRYLMDSLENGEREGISGIFGNSNAMDSDLHRIYSLMQHKGIYQKVQIKEREILQELKTSMDKEHWVTEEIKMGILALHHYNQSREK